MSVEKQYQQKHGSMQTKREYIDTSTINSGNTKNKCKMLHTDKCKQMLQIDRNGRYIHGFWRSNNKQRGNFLVTFYF